MSGLSGPKSPNAKNEEKKLKEIDITCISKTNFSMICDVLLNHEKAYEFIARKREEQNMKIMGMKESTGLSEQMCSKFCTEDAPHELWAWMSVFIGMRFLPHEAEYVLKLAGLVLRDNDQTHMAYKLLLNYSQNHKLSIEKANECLAKWGIPLEDHLGSKKRMKKE